MLILRRTKRQKSSSGLFMSSVVSADPPSATRLVLDTDVASFILKWHSRFAPAYLNLIRGRTLAISFTTVAEMRFGAINARWGQRRMDLLEAYVSEFTVLHSDDRMCFLWARVRQERARQGRRIDVADAWVAATALSLGAPLVTNNIKDFEGIANLQLLSVDPNSAGI